jgi:protein-serine/threonine kinase
MIENFEKMNILGIGASGTVYLVKNKNTQILYAMKVIPKKNSQYLNTKIATEYNILLNSTHPFISKIFHYFQSELEISMIMQYCAGGDFYHFLRSQTLQCINEKQTLYYASCILLALEYLHFNGIIYRDLKPENILVQSDGHIILTDFDLSVCASNKVVPHLYSKHYSHTCGVAAEPTVIMYDTIGTAEYIAPEIINQKPYTCIVDWWSYGILIYEMLYGYTPFKGRDTINTFKIICECKLVFPHETPQGIKLSHKVKNLIKKLLIQDPNKRFGHEGGATEIKDHPFFKNIHFQLLRNQIPPIIPKINNNI